MSEFIKIKDKVWCDKHGCIHEDTLDPYYYPGDADLCSPSDHLHLYRRERRRERADRVERIRQEAKRRFIAHHVLHLPATKGD